MNYERDGTGDSGGGGKVFRDGEAVGKAGGVMNNGMMNQVHEMDALEMLAKLEPQSVDAIITDLPYGTTACSWDNIIPFEPMWAGVKRVLKPRGVFVTTASQPFTSALVMSNPKWFKYDWTWIKSLSGMFVHAKNRPMKIHEDVLVFSPGVVNHESLTKNRMNYYPQITYSLETYSKKQKANKNNSNTNFGRRPSHKDFEVKDVSTRYPQTMLYFSNTNHHTDHPTQKPVALYDYLIRTYTQAGDLVVDFCCGSGTTAVAAATLNRRYIVGDTSAEYCAIARRRLETVTPDMFEAFGVVMNYERD